MPAIAHRKNAEFAGAVDHADSAPTATALTVFGTLRKGIVGTARIIMWVAQAFAEARAQRAQIEIDFYRNRFKHASKNDDDLPMVR